MKTAQRIRLLELELARLIGHIEGKGTEPPNLDTAFELLYSHNEMSNEDRQEDQIDD